MSVEAAEREETGVALSVRDLRVSFATPNGRLRAVDGVSFDVRVGEVLALVGESGSGKTATGTSVLRLTELNHGSEVSGEILVGATDVMTLNSSRLRRIRGRHVGLVLQNPMTALSPVKLIGSQLIQMIREHTDLGRRDARARAIELLQAVGVPDAEQRLDSYPQQLSGGTLQRIVIAMAIACGPEVLIADEPTTALDVTMQQQILDLLSDLIDEIGMGVLFVTHNLGVVAGLADRVAIMYAGRIVEVGPVSEVFANSRHPYTAALLHAVPQLDHDRDVELAVIPGAPYQRIGADQGCAFRARCPVAVDRCETDDPQLMDISADHLSACWVQPRAHEVLAATTMREELDG
ncbi:ABC transporter ATP-binding protein [Glaciibacter superstes]|uniref:ABC transporter ATP-binding protein n=1 Tax=Glaciibacter superstes TaxID=501023 RepID=UPI0003B67B99|nr:ABC transporter ATP-binding protein [Glaciibacter superstes]